MIDKKTVEKIIRSKRPSAVNFSMGALAMDGACDIFAKAFAAELPAPQRLTFMLNCGMERGTAERRASE